VVMGCNSSKKADAAKDRKFRAADKKRDDAKGGKAGTGQAKDTGSGSGTGAANGTPVAATPIAVGPGAAAGAPAAAVADEVMRTPAKGIAAPNQPKGSRADEDGITRMYGTSLTNKRTKELDLLHKIVEQTQHNFIEVHNNKQNLDDDGLDERRANAKYKALGDSAVGGGGGGLLAAAMPFTTKTITLPVASDSTAAAAGTASAGPSISVIVSDSSSKSVGDIVSVLSGTNVPPEDITLMGHALDAVSTALASALCVMPVGPVVLTFEELQRFEFQ